mmetsp:Transcript_6180/g.13454  ORF Transcript_6180/g.13454 Transcript_6180/m.13454 type:complete len:471 (-) Transcript_6180:459-1871(-)|eukprot:CAMPEP_0202913832 /NCGR_PEP_ID=MMETSP1392-20130828/61565_1 /ASSEMBLY_ACC=CAM_ASM_000868 /TAXON_ID=225041 /ORGANISM="Chlamydomonas chlamydogama, Strain SAG 11-48b" /LENGTH=470 /DNA_ID=CAMNT_0049605249 /DNA_START=121 /DNA_END=1533 /DNA_ORIENTATION=+
MPPNPARANQIRQSALSWLEQSRKAGLVNPYQKIDTTRSQAATGISIDFLKRFSDSLRAIPLLPTFTYTIVRDIISVATCDQSCRLIDVVPPAHVGYPTYFISHNWNFNFHDLVNTLYEDFEQRWQAYLVYRGKQRGGQGDTSAGLQAPSTSSSPTPSPEDEEQRRKLLGYYVWLDVAAVNQHMANPVDLVQVSRLVHVTGRTVLILDDECSTLGRLWCCYEVWATVRHNRPLCTLTLNNNLRPSSPGIGDIGDGTGSDAGQDGPRQLPPVQFSTAKCTFSSDKAAIMAVFKEEVANPKHPTRTLDALAKELHDAVKEARDKELKRQELMTQVYTTLTLCSKLYARSYTQLVYKDVDAARHAAKAIVNDHFAQEHSKAKLLNNSDVELELWETLNFLHRLMEKQREEAVWVQEFHRFTKLAYRSFATRFSNSYVDNLLKQAGTFDDMSVLSQYVHSSCKIRIESKRDRNA